MGHHEEVASGIAFITQEAQNHGCFVSQRRIESRTSYYFQIERDKNAVDFTLSEEFLSDLPGSPTHQAHVKEALANFSKRLRNMHGSDFYAISGTPFNLSIHWPANRHPSRDVVWLHADVEDIRFPDLISKVAAVISGGLEVFEFRLKPFDRIATIVDAIRSSLDNTQLQFFKRDEHPQELQEVSIFDLPRHSRIADDLIEQFLAAKVYWLGFERGDKTAPVWIADPWDSSYLGVGSRDLIRAAQVVQARGLIRLNGEFAHADDALILSQREAESFAGKRRIGFI